MDENTKKGILDESVTDNLLESQEDRSALGFRQLGSMVGKALSDGKMENFPDGSQQERGLEAPLVDPVDLLASAGAAKIATKLSPGVAKVGGQLLKNETGSLGKGVGYKAADAVSDLHPLNDRTYHQIKSDMKKGTFGSQASKMSTDEQARQLSAEYATKERLQRARDQGFDPHKMWYHGSNADIQAFDPNKTTDLHKGRIAGFFTKSEDFADEFASGNSTKGSAIYPVHLSVQNPFDYANPKHVDALMKSLSKETLDELTAGDKLLTTNLRKSISKGDWAVLEEPKLIDAIKALGHDSMHVLEKDSKNIAVFDPSHIRSTYAEFDPSKKGQSGLSFAEGGQVPDTNAINYDALMPQTDVAPQVDSLGSASSQVNVLNPYGSLVSINQADLQDALGSGYTMPSQEAVDSHFKQEQYGSGTQQAIAGLEGAAQGILGPAAPLLETQVLGVPEADILGRAEANPVTHYGSEILGLGASLATGYGLGAAAAKVGGLATAGVMGSQLATKAPVIAKLGSAAVASGLENMIIAGSDEASKMILKDPRVSAETAIADIGLAGVLGGAIGGAFAGGHALWKASPLGREAGEVLEAIANKAGGIEGVINDPIERAIIDSGMELSPEIKAAVVNDPAIQHMFSALQESATKSGLKAQTALKEFRQQAAEGISGALGFSSSQIDDLSRLSAHEAGETVKETLSRSLKETFEPIGNMFDNVKSKYSKEVLTDGAKADISSRIGQLIADEGYALSPSSPQYKVIQNTIDELGGLKTLEDVRKYQSILNDKTYGNPDLRRVGGQLKGILRDVEDDAVVNAVGRISPAAIEEHALARSGYKEAMGVLDDLNDRLHVGRYSGPKSFIKALDEMKPEEVLSRLSRVNDAGLIAQLSERFPQVAESVRQYKLSELLHKASKTALPGEVINVKAFMKSVDNLSPEMRNFIIPESAQVKVKAIQAIADAIPHKMNPSGTAKAVDSLLGHLPASGLGIGALLLGHGPAAAALTAYLGKKLTRDVPDAIKLATLKFLGSNKPIEPGAFKSMVEFMQASIRGENMLTKGVKSVVNGSKSVMPEGMKPSEADRNKLNKMLLTYSNDNQKLLNLPGDSGHYLSDHAASIAMVSGSAIAYLNNLRPNTDPRAPLDAKNKPNFVQEQKFKNALNIAQQPLILLEKIQKGTITVNDIGAVKNIYPSLYNRMAEKLTSEVIEAKNKGKTIPYQTRIGMSMFLGQPLDSTMTPMGIMSAQPRDPASVDSGPARAKPGTKAFQESAQSSMSPSQSKASHRQSQ